MASAFQRDHHDPRGQLAKFPQCEFSLPIHCSFNLEPPGVDLQLGLSKMVADVKSLIRRGELIFERVERKLQVVGISLTGDQFAGERRSRTLGCFLLGEYVTRCTSRVGSRSHHATQEPTPA